MPASDDAQVSPAKNTVPFLQHSAKNRANGLCVGLFFIAWEMT